MHGLLHHWPTTVLGLAIAAGGAALALGQPDYPTPPAAVSELPGGESPGAIEPTSNLESRLAEPAVQPTKTTPKQAAEKPKAADKPSVSVGGRILADWALFNQSPDNMLRYGDIQDGCEFRQVRIFLKGEAFDVVDYKLEVDLADMPPSTVATPGTAQSTAFNDVYLTINELPWLGHVRIGHFKEPFSLEGLTAVKYLTFMERATGVDPFYLRWNMGIMAFDQLANQRMTWAIGAFRTEMGSEPPIRQDDDGGTSLTMRYTFLPWYDEATEGRGLLHTGVAYSYRDVDNATARFSSRPAAHLAPYVADTGNIAGVSHWQQVGVEAALVYGPFSAQTEYSSAFVDRPTGPQVDFHGVYVYVSYFLTGENRAYQRSTGTFVRMKPYENFFRVRTSDGGIATGKGAWEVAYRYSSLDLNDADVLGGRSSDHTLGLNWYLNPYTRIAWNYVHCRATPDVVPESDLNVFEMRAQIEF
jgi:phosphate-selective porin OprO/OprP